MKLTDIITYINNTQPTPTITEIAKHFNKSVSTMNRYISLLRKAGYTVPIKQGRPTSIIIE